MKGKLLTFGLILALLITTTSISSSTYSFDNLSNKPLQTFSTSQNDDIIEFHSNAEIAQSSSAGVGTRSDPYILEGLNTRGIQFYDTTAFFILRDSGFVIPLLDMSVIEIDPVRFENVAHGTIENCIVSGGDVGITIRDSRDCAVINSQVYDAYTGIQLDSSTNSTILACNSFRNSIGMMVINSDFCGIINNSIYSNSERGLHVEVFCDYTIVAGNSIGWNTILNAIDNGADTTYTDGVSFGNEWSDYNPSETYAIQGTGGSTDLFASLLTDTQIPVVYDVRDQILDIESNGETITWSVSDEFPLRYQIYLNDEILEDRTWDGRDHTVSLDDLSVGTHTYILNVTDAAGNTHSTDVVVSVISFILGGIGTELVMLASGVTVAIFLILILILKKIP